MITLYIVAGVFLAVVIPALVEDYRFRRDLPEFTEDCLRDSLQCSERCYLSQIEEDFEEAADTFDRSWPLG